jgi:hypothetical protein
LARAAQIRRREKTVKGFTPLPGSMAGISQLAF